jgi:hypothetical protein
MRAAILAILLVWSSAARADDASAPAPEPIQSPSSSKNVAWLLVGGALTFATTGAVLAYSTSSAEQDIRDLYTSPNGRLTRFDANTRRRYEDLVDEGNRYQTLSFVAFGLTAACAAGAAYFFWRSVHEPAAPTIAPVVTPSGAGVRLTF